MIKIYVSFIGVWLFEDPKIREVSNGFQALLTNNLGYRAKLDRLDFATLSPDEGRNLEIPSREEEVFIALTEVEGDQSPGHDGFTLAFW